MNEILKSYEKTIKLKHSISWTPKYQEDFNTSINNNVFIAIVEKTFEKLEWDLVYKDENNAEAKRKETRFGHERRTEIIYVSYNFGNVEVTSESLNSKIWDWGRNSKRVKLFIFAFEETLKMFDSEAIKELEKEYDKKNNWDDYIIPETLPQPIKLKKTNFSMPIIAGIFLSLILGFILAFISTKEMYRFGAFEILAAITIAFVMNYLFKFSNFTDLRKLQYLLFAMVILVYLSSQYFLYEIILSENSSERISFGEFMKLRFSIGLVIKDLNTGWIGLVIKWIIQIGFTMLIVYAQIMFVFIDYMFERTPIEVIDFACYHFIKGKSEEEVRKELTKKGWIEVKDQDAIFEAIGNLQSIAEYRRMK